MRHIYPSGRGFDNPLSPGSRSAGRSEAGMVIPDGADPEVRTIRVAVEE
ncbi:hypothetical protein ACWD01_14370 [Streptomyces sp. NPDC002835]|jgi:hypothetical protein